MEILFNIKCLYGTENSKNIAFYTTVSPTGGTGATRPMRQYSHYCYSTFMWD